MVEERHDSATPSHANKTIMTAYHTPASLNPGLPKLRFVRLLKAKLSWVDLPTFFLFVITAFTVAASASFCGPVAIGGPLLLVIGTWALSVAVIPSSDVLKSGSALRGSRHLFRHLYIRASD